MGERLGNREKAIKVARAYSEKWILEVGYGDPRAQGAHIVECYLRGKPFSNDTEPVNWSTAWLWARRAWGLRQIPKCIRKELNLDGRGMPVRDTATEEKPAPVIVASEGAVGV